MTDPQELPPTVAEVLGRTAKTLRGDRKVEHVAHAAKSAGLNWGTGRIADLEAGRVSPTLPTLFVLCQAFGALLDRPLRLADLFAGDGPVRLTGTDATVELAELREALSGGPVDPGGAGFVAMLSLEGAVAASEQFLAAGVEPPDVVKAQVRGHPVAQRVRQSMLEADYRVARSLGLDDDDAAILMGRLWGRSFTAQRDRLSEPGANAQKRGRVSRDLKAKLREAINRGDD